GGKAIRNSKALECFQGPPLPGRSSHRCGDRALRQLAEQREEPRHGRKRAGRLRVERVFATPEGLERLRGKLSKVMAQDFVSRPPCQNEFHRKPARIETLLGQQLS